MARAEDFGGAPKPAGEAPALPERFAARSGMVGDPPVSARLFFQKLPVRFAVAIRGRYFASNNQTATEACF
jgi:hypothetical protein